MEKHSFYLAISLFLISSTEDEEERQCAATESQCEYETCIDSKKACDSEPDCPDWSDELDCDDISTPVGKDVIHMMYCLALCLSQVIVVDIRLKLP